MNKILRNCYYSVKPIIPRKAQLSVRRWLATLKRSRHSEVWPIDWKSGRSPDRWNGWPDNKRFALVLTHDVDTPKGYERCMSLAELEVACGFRSSFNFVAEGYPVSERIREHLTRNGFEVGIHGLKHNGTLFDSHDEFKRQSATINRYLKEWRSVGFRSPCMYHDLGLFHNLDIQYDASTFDTDPFEPQPDGVSTIFPFLVRDQAGGSGYVELPYTLPQDFTLFILFREKNVGTWKKKLDWVAQCGGMVLLNSHPDYMKLEVGDPGYDEYPAELYQEFLNYVKARYGGEYWHALPKEVAAFWRQHVESF